ncbi:4'-phosphopantetheinyl transferase family protein [Aeromonas schubertii]|uniref:4'-phosphopantetheinyl transferase family protein n=1 Tax=Aeromonas schubertii TaxID=652 RepID=UPI001CC5BADB|nr:4'-phosphopantetheinyl transferase superfamily protein [Aeromonas schubertii]MBZ6071502.1 4'-phosphopantetheinyl transferase superfamily protein [Aeromonas schubertii]
MVHRVDLFLFCLTGEETQISPDLQACLPADERQHAARFTSPGRARQWLLTRALLRRELGRRLPGHPLHFGTLAGGKPCLLDDAWYFNLTHSGDWAVLALCQEGPVGVDLELGRRARDLLKLARRFFAPEESQWLAALPEPSQADGFYRLWARKEALLKAHGGGLAAGLENVIFHPAQEWRLENRLDHHTYEVSDSPFQEGWLALATRGTHHLAIHWLDERLEICPEPPHLAINL